MPLGSAMIDGTRKVAVVMHRLKDQPWGVRLREEFEAALADHPEISYEFCDPEGDPTLQAHLVEQHLRAGVDALVVLPLDRDPIRAALRAHQASDIPVIAMDGDIDDPSLYRTLILADNRLFGRKMGEFFLEVTGGTAELVEIRGVPTTTGAQHRSAGFREAVARSQIRIVQSLVGNWVYSQAREEFARLLPRLPRLDGVFAQNDEMARAAWDVAHEAGRADELLITGIDALKGEHGLQLVMQGKLAATLLNPNPGRPAASALLAILSGEPCLPKIVLQTSMFRSHERIRAWQEARRARAAQEQK
jgi:ABC-type sugar transport system substrate-binding protein